MVISSGKPFFLTVTVPYLTPVGITRYPSALKIRSSPGGQHLLPDPNPGGGIPNKKISNTAPHNKRLVLGDPPRVCRHPVPLWEATDSLLQLQRGLYQIPRLISLKQE